MEAQPAEDEAPILLAAAEYFIHQLVADTSLPRRPQVLLDERIITWEHHRGLEQVERGIWADAVLREVARGLDARVGSIAAFRDCREERGPNRCVLREIDAAVAFGFPEIEAERATIPVLVIHRSLRSEDPTVAYPVHRIVELERVNGHWQVRGVRTLTVG